jgi:SAM-dependent methyltransferase
MAEGRAQTDAQGSEELVPSDWVRRFTPLIEAGGVVADIACGSGRHTRWLLEQGYSVVAFDRDPSRLRLEHPRLDRREVDLEDPAGFSFEGETYAAVLVTHYLYRPLFEALIGAVNPAGVFLYETFGIENVAFGRPRNPDFLLAPGELIERVAPTLRIVAYEHGYLAEPRPRVVQRIAAVGAGRSLADCGLGPAGV